jgi:hypothetical protein
MRKHWKAIGFTIALFSAVALASGCGNNSGTNSNGVKSQGYSDDGFLGMTNNRPRLPGHHTVTNFGVDNGSMRDAIKNVPGVADSNVTFNGADAYVTIKLEKGLLAREIPTVEQQAATVLRFNYPRYTIHVTSLK